MPAAREQLAINLTELLGIVDHEVDDRVVIILQKLRADCRILEIRLDIPQIRAIGGHIVERDDVDLISDPQKLGNEVNSHRAGSARYEDLFLF